MCAILVAHKTRDAGRRVAQANPSDVTRFTRVTGLRCIEGEVLTARRGKAALSNGFGNADPSAGLAAALRAPARS